MRPVELFHIGPQKSGTTWILRCLEQHPDVVCPARGWVNYFDMHYARGRKWYAAHYSSARPPARCFDPTPSYLRSTAAPRRIRLENPDARIAITLRHPLERAFSHFWHEKQKGRIDYAFAEVLDNYDLFSNWVEPGFYAEHLERWLECFPREQILCQRFEGIATQPGEFFDELCAHFGIATGHRPPDLERKIDAAGPRRSVWHAALHKVDRVLQRVGLQGGAIVGGKRAYEEGVDPAVGERLEEICAPEIARLESLLGVDLEGWRHSGCEVQEAVAS